VATIGVSKFDMTEDEYERRNRGINLEAKKKKDKKRKENTGRATR